MRAKTKGSVRASVPDAGSTAGSRPSSPKRTIPVQIATASPTLSARNMTLAKMTARSVSPCAMILFQSFGVVPFRAFLR